MNSRVNFYDIEKVCQHYFDRIGDTYHLCTPENHPIIFRNQEDFKTGMSLAGIAAKAHSGIKILTFELMSNHIHFIISGTRKDIEEFFRCLCRLLCKCLYKDDCHPDLSCFTMHLHEIETLENLRNAIAYVNRNGSVIDRHVCPYTYPWGANKYYFNPESKLRYQEQKIGVTLRDRRKMTRSHRYDDLTDLYSVDGNISPLSFCYISEGEQIFRDARHYFTKVSRHIESYDEIAKTIGEQVYYTDDDLFSIACTMSVRKYGCKVPSQLSKNQKIELARMIHGDYNANIRQLQRILKIDISVLTAMFGNGAK